jgi:hypothetical protein
LYCDSGKKSGYGKTIMFYKMQVQAMRSFIFLKETSDSHKQAILSHPGNSRKRTAVLNMAIIPSSMFVSTPLNERPGH